MISNSMQIVEPQGRRLRGRNGLHFISSLKIRKRVLHGDEARNGKFKVNGRYSWEKKSHCMTFYIFSFLSHVNILHIQKIKF